MPYTSKADQAAAAKRWYAANREVTLQRSAANNKRTRDENRKVLRKAKQRPCIDCGQSFPPIVMDLDHRPGEVKLGEVSTMAHGNVSLAKLRAEIAKCDVVCANCHRIRTARRAGWDLDEAA